MLTRQLSQKRASKKEAKPVLPVAVAKLSTQTMVTGGKEPKSAVFTKAIPVRNIILLGLEIFYTSLQVFFIFILFSSPEPKVQVRLYHSVPSVVRPSSINFSHFQLLDNFQPLNGF